MFRLMLAMWVSVVALCAYADDVPVKSADVIQPARDALITAQNALTARQWEHAGNHAELLLKTGHTDEALAMFGTMENPDSDTRLTMLRLLLARHDYPQAMPLIERLDGEVDKERAALYSWWSLTGDAGRIDRALQSRAGALTLADEFAAAALSLSQLNYAGALDRYLALQKVAQQRDDQVRATRGVGLALYHLQRYNESLDALGQALAIDPSDADVLVSIGETLLRLGRVDEAIDVLRFALKVAPWNERAHQLLGSGFTRRNYTQLHAVYAKSFADAAGQRLLKRADKELAERHISEARTTYLTVATHHPEWADAEVRLGSLDYAQSNFIAARDHYWKAIQLCPEYGRAHEGLGRALEALRLQIDVHHEQDEAALNAAAMPVIPRIADYVINWNALSARHQKRLALSLQPWSRYIPALLLGGATLYVKPGYQLLSESPYQEQLKDQRIDYDSRLWDDVRGEGGLHVVVSTEDLEARISSVGYDTTLHEVSHQVHAILSPQWSQRIQTLFAQAQRRQTEFGNAFLSQYAASSVYEYFAEGANSLNNRRRDPYDTREIVLERLEARDPALKQLVSEIMHEADLGPSDAAALVSRGDDLLARGQLRQADAAYEQAIRRDPLDERALAARMHSLVILHDLDRAGKLAASARATLPDSGVIALASAEVAWLEGTPPTAVIGALETARNHVDAAQRYLVDLQIGDLAYHVGNASTAQHAYAEVLADQPDNPQALVGLAGVAALQGAWAQAWTYYESAVRIRAGDQEIRIAYARDLLRAGELARARLQIDTALLLSPDSPETLALQAWDFMETGQLERAVSAAQRAHRLGPWSTLATIVAAAVERRAGHAKSAATLIESLNDRLGKGTAPNYIYPGKSGGYYLAFTLPAVELGLIKTLTLGPGS